MTPKEIREYLDVRFRKCIAVCLSCVENLCPGSHTSHYVSQARRVAIIDKLDEKARGLRPAFGRHCKEDLGNTGKYLFGPQFLKALTDKAEAISSFAKVAQKVSNPQSTGRAKTFFQSGPTSAYGGG